MTTIIVKVNARGVKIPIYTDNKLAVRSQSSHVHIHSFKILKMENVKKITRSPDKTTGKIADKFSH